MKSHSAESSKVHCGKVIRWYNESNRGRGSETMGRSGHGQKFRKMWRCEIVDRLEGKTQITKINVIFYRKPVKLPKDGNRPD